MSFDDTVGVLDRWSGVSAAAEEPVVAPVAPLTASDSEELQKLIEIIPGDLPADVRADLITDITADVASHKVSYARLQQTLQARIVKAQAAAAIEAAHKIEALIHGYEEGLSAATKQNIIIRSHNIELGDDAALKRMAAAYDHPDAMIALWKQNPELVANWNAVPESVRVDGLTKNEAAHEMVKDLLKKYPSGKAHDLLVRIEEDGLYRYENVQEALAKAILVDNELGAEKELGSVVKTARARDTRDRGSVHVPPGTPREAVNDLLVQKAIIDGSIARGLSRTQAVALATKQSAWGETMDDAAYKAEVTKSLQASGAGFTNEEIATAATSQSAKKVQGDITNDPRFRAAMKRGYEEIAKGNPQQALDMAKEVEKLLGDYGYPPERVRAVGQALRNGAYSGNSSTGKTFIAGMGEGFANTAVDQTIEGIGSILKTGHPNAFLNTMAVAGKAASATSTVVDAVAGTASGALNEAAEAKDDISRRAGTAQRVGARAIDKAFKGDWGGAAKEAQIATTAVGRNIVEAPGRLVKSGQDVIDQQRDSFEKNWGMGKQMNVFINDLQRLKHFDKDGDGRVELYEVVEKLKELGVTQIKDMNGDGKLNASDVELTYIAATRAKAAAAKGK